MAKFDLLSFSLVAVAVAILGLSLQSLSVDAQCDGGCDPKFVLTELKQCQANRTGNCPDYNCCYALGALNNVTNDCICAIAYKYLEPPYTKLYQLFQKCSSGARNVSCLLRA
ncbi:protein MpLTP-like74 [Marchantia polymorpha subsp. ruderalis]|uniref:Bifunctional inhibitor/plant lipid transfer protein/seed storage helical domain-containing protein n=2 Tax=Marchantia polymorpha TaxID=3197 RepID=A0AAF6BVF1_MARPO|nr:hypothetical protein MARPO_0088s0032 [Marchantia polymorpha]BBN15985.1 hypothetical protein Mp_7g02560 [Marchantia polymorpha subsp. ruderalis]|eukprot:PTQ33486.1 hypothetical protein MARPO_0088s0032 [Marchantia polymorpha]